MNKIVYVGTDKWHRQLSSLASSGKLEIVHSVIPLNSKKLRDACLQHNIPFTETKNVNSLESLLSTLDFNLFVVIGHPFLLKPSLLKLARGIGFHPSMLPERRGRAPLNWAIIDGLRKSGVSLFELVEGADEGLIYFQEEFTISKSDKVEDLVKKVDLILRDNLERIVTEWPNLKGEKQDESRASYTSRRYPEDGEIKSTMTNQEAERLVRALSGPYPSAFIKLKGGKKLYVHKVSLEDKNY